MNIYTVHLKGSPDDLSALERTVFVREGFSWAAFVFGPLWLLWNRFWLALLTYLVLEGALIVWHIIAPPAEGVTLTLQVLLHLAYGFEASQVRRAALKRRRFQAVGITHGRRLMEAERAYFLQASSRADTAASSRAAPLSVGSRPAEMVGLFPSAGV